MAEGRSPFVKPKSAPPEENPLRDSWKPSDKAEEARIDNPEEFEEADAAEDSTGPVPQTIRKTHGEPEEP